jgi:hypothetical protein
MFRTKVLEKKKTHFTLNNLFFPENGDVFEIVSKIVVEPKRPRMMIKYGA